jgi:hypothetical protein
VDSRRGGDDPEQQLHALTRLATEAGFRADSAKVIVWFGDAPGHDPGVGGETLDTTIAALTAAGIRVIAVPVNTVATTDLDSTGQATAIANATGGFVIPAGSPADVSDAIIRGLTNLPVDVSMTSDCDEVTGGDITVSFDPASQTVNSGDQAVFTETIQVAASAVPGSTYECNDQVLLNDVVMTDSSGNPILETKTIHIEDGKPPGKPPKHPPKRVHEK